MAVVANNIRVDWDSVAGATEYEVTLSDMANVVLATNITTVTYRIINFTEASALGIGTGSFKVNVRAKNANTGQVGDWNTMISTDQFNIIDITLASLGAGNSTTQDVGTTSGTVAAGNHSHTLANISDAGTMASQNMGASGSFTTVDGKTVSVSNGVITSIV